MIGARFDPAMVAAIDAWAAKAGDDVTRSEAIRRLVELGLRVKRLARQ